MTQTLEVTITRTVTSSAKAAFEAWLDPQQVAAFMMPLPNMSVPEVQLDTQVGGEFLVVMRAGDKDMPHTGQYKVIDKYTELAFSWHSNFTTSESLVTLNFKELSPQQTEVTLHHRGFPNEEARSNHQGGWTHILETLALYLGKSS